MSSRLEWLLTSVAKGAGPAAQTEPRAILWATVMSVGVVARSTERRTVRSVVVARAHQTVVEVQWRPSWRAVVRRGTRRPRRTRVQQMLRSMSPDQSPRAACNKRHQYPRNLLLFSLLTLMTPCATKAIRRHTKVLHMLLHFLRSKAATAFSAS